MQQRRKYAEFRSLIWAKIQNRWIQHFSKCNQYNLYDPIIYISSFLSPTQSTDNPDDIIFSILQKKAHPEAQKAYIVFTDSP